MEKKTSPNVISIGHERTAEMLVPNMAAKQELCIIPTEIAKHLLTLMPQASIGDVISRFSEKCADVQDEEDWIELLRQELNFHASMCMLKEQHGITRTPIEELVAR